MNILVYIKFLIFYVDEINDEIQIDSIVSYFYKMYSKIIFSTI